MTMKTLYEILGVDKDATDEEIKAAARKAKMKHHPDRGGEAKDFHEIMLAEKILLDPEKRKHYDATGDSGTDHIDTMEQQAIRIAVSMFVTTVMALDEKNIAYKDVIHACIDLVAETRVKAFQQMRHTETLIQKMEKALIRLRKKKKEKRGVDFLASALSREIEKAKMNVEEIKRDLAMADVMKAFFSEYDYQTDQVPLFIEMADIATKEREEWQRRNPRSRSK